jgi:hypothetical protein
MIDLIPLLMILALAFVLEGSLGCGFYDIDEDAQR